MILLVACRYNLKFSSVSGRPSFQSEKRLSSLRPKGRFATAVRLTVMLTRGVCRATLALFAIALAEVTTPEAMRPGPPSFSLENTKIASPSAMCLPPYIVFWALNTNVLADESLIAALITNVVAVDLLGRKATQSNTAVASISIRNSGSARADTPIQVLAGGFSEENASRKAVPTAVPHSA
jgi:hypothetical protein